MRQWPASVEGQTPVPLGDIQKYSKEVQIDLTVAHQDLEVRFPGIGRADHLSILHCPDDAEVWLKIDSPQAHPIRVRGQGAGISGFDSAPFERVFITNDPYAGGSVPPALIMQAGGDTGFKLTPVHSGDRVRVVDTVGIRRTDLHHITPADDIGMVPVDDAGTPLMTPTNPGRMLLHGSLPAGTNKIGAVDIAGVTDTSSGYLPVQEIGIRQGLTADLTLPDDESWVEVKAGAQRMADRRMVYIKRPDAGSIYWNFSTSGTGIELSSDATDDIILNLDPNFSVAVYLKSDGTERIVSILEAK